MSSMAMMPKAPGLFSISTGWPRIGRMCSPTMRITMSVALPGPNGTTTLTGFDGYLSCASAAALPTTTHAPSNKKPRRLMLSSSHGREQFEEHDLLGHLDLHLGDILAPHRKLAVEPRLRVLERRVRLDADVLLLEAFLQLRGTRGLDDRLEQRRQDLFRRVGR